MKYHFQIISKKAEQDTENTFKYVHTSSEDFMIMDGFGGEENFIGWDDAERARFWARDRMKLYSLNENDYTIKIIEKMYIPKPIKDEQRYIPVSKDSPLEDERLKAKMKRIRGKDKNTLI